MWWTEVVMIRDVVSLTAAGYPAMEGLLLLLVYKGEPAGAREGQANYNWSATDKLTET